MARVPVIKTVNLCKYYKLGKTVVRGSHKINLEVYSGEFIVIFGPSGCGKSTLMSLLAGLDEPTSGEILVRGERLNGLNHNQLAKYRRTKIGMIFQQYNLIKTMTASENVALPLMFEGKPKRLRMPRAVKCLEMVGMLEYKDHTPAELSGGQQQRVAIARSWAASPWVIFGDEPTGNLDSKSADYIMDLLSQLNKKSKRTIVVITHNPDYRKYADRIVYLKDGQITKIEGKVKGAAKKVVSGVDFLKISDTFKDELKKIGVTDADTLLKTKISELTKIKGINEVKAAKLQKEATKFLEEASGSLAEDGLKDQTNDIEEDFGQLVKEDKTETEELSEEEKAVLEEEEAKK